jgi:hypothetical protein
MAALPAYLAATTILMPEEHRPPRPKAVFISHSSAPRNLQGLFDSITEVHAISTETLESETVDKDYLAPFSRRWHSETETPNLTIGSRTLDLTTAAPRQVEFLSDQDFTVHHPFTTRRDLVLDPLVNRILRKHFLTEILAPLSKLQMFARSELAATYANELFKLIRTVRDRLPTDPFSAILIALHDALAFENNWIRYTAEQFGKARELLIRFANQDLHEQKALKAIALLEDIGFDTTPFYAPEEPNAAA